MIFLIIIIFIIAVLFAFWYLDRKPLILRKISQNDLNIHLRNLLNRGYDRGFMIIQIPKDKKVKRILQFSKYIGKNKLVGLQFDYPLADWSKPYYEKLKSILNNNQIEFEIQKTNYEKVPEFIVVDIKKDIEKALYLSTLLLKELYGLSKEDTVELFMENVSPKEEKIGF
jgi:hypothetical protein